MKHPKTLPRLHGLLAASTMGTHAQGLPFQGSLPNQEIAVLPAPEPSSLALV